MGVATRRAGLLFVVLLLCGSGCSSARKGGPWAGMSQYDAGNAANQIVQAETGRSDSPIYGKDLAVLEMKRGVRSGDRRPVWVVSMENYDDVRSPFCIFLWGKFIPFQAETVKYSVARCPDS